MTKYDVFLCHAADDKPAIEALARRLRESGLKPFFDFWCLVPGEPWQERLEESLESSGACAVLIGEALGPWQIEEMRVALDRRVHDADFHVIPVLLPGASRPSGKELPSFLRRLHWVDFRAGLDDQFAYHSLLAAIRGDAPGAGVGVPPAAVPYRAKLPAGDFFVPRREFKVLLDLLLGVAGSTVGITTALRGAGGFGKTALARALCDAPQVRSAYPSGILWTTMGEGLNDADRRDRVLDLIRWWTDKEPPGFKSAHDAGAYLKKILAGQRLLVVVDDVWQVLDLEPFHGLEPGTVLVTTRNVRTLANGTRRVNVDALARSEAVALLAHGLSSIDRGRLGVLAERLGEWPLLLRLVNSQLLDLVRERGLDVPAALERVQSRLDKAGLRALNRRDATERSEALSLTMNVSLDALSPASRRRYIDLAVFPQDVDVPIRIVERLWEVDDWTAEDLCLQLDDFSLLDFDVKQQTLRLHNVVREYLVGECDDLPALHRRLLECCRPTSGRWAKLGQDGDYFWPHLAYHHAQAKQNEAFQDVLFDFEYLKAKLAATDVDALIADYNGFQDNQQARDVRGALQLASHVLTRNKNELGVQLSGRLECGRPPFIDRLLGSSIRHSALRFRRSSLRRPGSALIRVLEGHEGVVNAVAKLDTGRIVSSSSDGTLRVWDADSGKMLRILGGHTAPVYDVAVLDERRVVSASDDGTLRTWDTQTGETIRTFEGHTGPVGSVAVLAERRVVSGSTDGTLRVWDTDSGKALRVWDAKSGQAHAISLAPVYDVAVLDQKLVVSASYDGRIRIWDADSGELVKTLAGWQLIPVQVVAVINRAVLAACGIEVRIWNPDSGETEFRDTRFGIVRGMALLDDGTWVFASAEGLVHITGPSGPESLEGHTGPLNDVAVLDERRVVTASYDKTLRIWDVSAGGKPLDRSEIKDDAPWVRRVGVLNKRRILSLSGSQNNLRILDADSGKLLQTLDTGVYEFSVMDERRVVTISADGKMQVFDVDSGRAIRTIAGPKIAEHLLLRGIFYQPPLYGLTVLDNGRIASALGEKPYVWDVESDELRTIGGPEDWSQGIAILDKMRFVSLLLNGHFCVWSMKTGEVLQIFEDHADHPLGFVVVDKSRVVSWSGNTLHVWDVDSGKALRTLDGHTGRVGQAAVLDERRIVSASSDSTLRFWDVDSGICFETATFDVGVFCVALDQYNGIVVVGDEGGDVHVLDLDERLLNASLSRGQQ